MASLISTPMVSIVLVSLLFFLYLKRRSSSPKLPPGPMALPIIGNLHNLVGSVLPHRMFRDLSERYGPLMHLKLGEVSTLIVSSPDMAREVMKTHDLSFAHRPKLFVSQVCTLGQFDIALAPYGEYWKQMKKIVVTELLSSQKIKSFSFIREEETRNLVKSIRGVSPLTTINLSEKFYEFTSTMFCRSAFGNKVDKRVAKELIGAVMDAIRLASGLELADLWPSSKLLQAISPVRVKLEKIYRRGCVAIQAIVDAHIDSQSGEGTLEDFIDVLLRLQKSNTLAIPITIKHIHAIVVDVFAGGTETTSTTMEWTMAELIRNPSVMKKVQAEIRQRLNGKTMLEESDVRELSYLKLVIKESLRLHPAVPLLLPRECRVSCSIGGYEIPTKTRVLINAWAIGRDPKYWKDAESFVPERFLDSSADYKGANFELTPFGAGRRMCPGISFALTNVELVLANLLYHFDWHLPDGMKPSDLDTTELFGATVVMKHRLNVKAVPFMSSDE